MEAKELRIGNLVRAKSPEKQEFESPVVVGINYLEMFCREPKRVHFEPITLTEEWLSKLGFLKTTWDTGATHWRGYNRLIIKRGEYFIDYASDMKIHSVHQLQNLTFALTGQEIELKTYSSTCG